MAKDRPIPHLKTLTTWLSSGEGAAPEAYAADAPRARAALDAKDAGTLVSLPVELQVAAAEVLAARQDVATLVSLEERTAYKDVRKAAGRALHVLRTKGVKVDEPAPRGDGFRYHVVDGEQPRSYASITDPEGDRMVWLGLAHAQEGRMAFQAVINEVTGIGLFQIFPQMTAKIRRLILAELEEKKIPVYDVDPDYARWLIEEGHRRNLDTSTEVPKEYFQGEPYMGDFQDLGSDPHPVYGILLDKGLGGEPTDEEVSRGSSLHDLEEVSTWLPTGDILDTVDKQVTELTGGAVLSSVAEQREKLAPLFETSTTEYFTAEVRTRWHRRLLDLGQHLLGRNKLELGRLAVSVGDRIGDAASDVAKNPFAVELFHKWYKARAEMKPEATEATEATAEATEVPAEAAAPEANPAP